MEVDSEQMSKVAILRRPRPRDLSHLSRRAILCRSVEFHWIWCVLVCSDVFSGQKIFLRLHYTVANVANLAIVPTVPTVPTVLTVPTYVLQTLCFKLLLRPPQKPLDDTRNFEDGAGRAQ